MLNLWIITVILAVALQVLTMLFYRKRYLHAAKTYLIGVDANESIIRELKHQAVATEDTINQIVRGRVVTMEQVSNCVNAISYVLRLCNYTYNEREMMWTHITGSGAAKLGVIQYDKVIDFAGSLVGKCGAWYTDSDGRPIPPFKVRYDFVENLIESWIARQPEVILIDKKASVR